MNKEKQPYKSYTLIHGIARRGDTLTVRDEKGVSVTKKSYSIWMGMLNRCYDAKFQKQHPTYKGCYVCKEWLLYSDFEIWYDKNIPDTTRKWSLDKDILIQGNKVYSPETCCFVPQEVNSLFAFSTSARGRYPLGVLFSKSKMCFQGSLTKDKINLRKDGFLTAKDAHLWYLSKKREHIQEKADKMRKEGLISEKIHQAMIDFKVENVDKGVVVQEDDLLPEKVILVDTLGREEVFYRLKDLVSKVGSIHQLRSIVKGKPNNTGWSLVKGPLVLELICKLPCGRFIEIQDMEVFCEKYNLNPKSVRKCIQDGSTKVNEYVFYKRYRRLEE